MARKAFRWAILVLGLVVLAGGASAQVLQPATPLPVGRAFHGAAVLGDFLYVFGGSWDAPGRGQSPVGTVHVAKVAEDGGLSHWITTTPITKPRHYISNSTIVLNDTVYILGGSTEVVDGARVNTIAWTRPQPNGILQPWRESEPFSETGLSAVAGFATPGWLHLTGGLRPDDTTSSSVWSVRLNRDGSPGTWRRGPELPEPLWFHNAAVVGGRAYLWGGLNDDIPGQRVPSDRVYTAPILASGLLGEWERVDVRLPRGIYSAVSAVAGPYLFSICPRYQGGTRSSDILWTYITPDGMQEWRRTTSGITNQLYRATATDYRRGGIYVVGGKPDLGTPPQPQTFFIALSPAAREAGEQSWSEKQVASARASGATVDVDPATGSLAFTDQNRDLAGSLPGFYNLEAAQALSVSQRMPMVMYFGAEGTQPAADQLGLISSEDFSALLERAVFAYVDARREPQTAQSYGVFRVPTWIFFDSGGRNRERLFGVQEPAAIADVLSGL